MLKCLAAVSLCLLLASIVTGDGHTRDIRSPQGPPRRRPTPERDNDQPPERGRWSDFEHMHNQNRPPGPGGPPQNGLREDNRRPPNDDFHEPPGLYEPPNDKRPQPPPIDIRKTLESEDHMNIEKKRANIQETSTKKFESNTNVDSSNSKNQENLKSRFTDENNESETKTLNQSTDISIKDSSDEIKRNLLQKIANHSIMFQALAVTPEN